MQRTLAPDDVSDNPPNVPPDRARLYDPRDRGQLNALQGILAAVSDELRQREPVINGIIGFTVQDFPSIIRDHTPFDILKAGTSANPGKASPYPFVVGDLVQQQNQAAQGRPPVFNTIAELVSSLDLNALSAPLRDVELIGIDESQVDNPLPHSSLTYMRSIAFRMYKYPDGTQDEAVGPIVSELRTQLSADESFEAENRLLGYIRNLYVAYISALTSLAFARKPFIVLHGPLVRAIGGFAHLWFSEQTIRELLNIDWSTIGQFPQPANASAPVSAGDDETINNISFAPLEAASGTDNLRRFQEFCRACPEVCTKRDGGVQKYRGACLYFWVLRSLLDLCRLKEITLASVVEDVSRSTEMTHFVLPSLFANPQARQEIEQSSLRTALRTVNLNFGQSLNRSEIYRKAIEVIGALHLSDSSLFTYLLAEGQYTAPVQTYRYQTRETFRQVLNYQEWGIDNDLAPILAEFFPKDGIAPHPGYRVLMSYVRTTPMREPIRVEYFDLPHQQPPEQVIGPVYLMSLPYQSYGLPMILYYTDKLARTPTQLVRTIIEREFLNLILQNRFSNPVSVMQILGRLTRNYFKRG